MTHSIPSTYVYTIPPAQHPSRVNKSAETDPFKVANLSDIKIYEKKMADSMSKLLALINKRSEGTSPPPTPPRSKQPSMVLHFVPKKESSRTPEKISPSGSPLMPARMPP